MRKRWLGIMTALAGILLAGTAQAAVVYEDNFDNDTLATNTNGVGGGMTSRTIRGVNHYWDDTGVLQFVTTGNTHYLNRVIAYTDSGFQSSEGFELTVSAYMSTRLGSSAISFGLVSDDTDFASYSGLHPFAGNATVYGYGVNMDNQNLYFSTGTNGVSLGSTTALTLNADHVAVMNIAPDGSGGADCIWSIDDVNQGTNNIAEFDFSKTYHFVAYGQDDQGNKRINSVLLEALGNSTPVADSQSVKTYPDTPLDITLTGSDPEGSNLTYNVTLQPTNGTLDVTSIPDVIYTPTNGYEGVDSFAFTVNDGDLTSAPATVSITVAPNDAPIADAQNLQTQIDNALDITLTASDPDNGPSNLTYNVLSQPSNGLLTTNGALPNLTYTPDAAYEGPDSFTFSVFDGLSNSTAATISITVTNELPVADAQNLDVFPDTTLDITLSGSDPDNGPSNLTYTVESLPANGSLTTNGALPNLTYTPNLGYVGPDSFTFSVFDGALTSDPATISIAVTNYVPTADSQYVATEYGSNVVIVLTGTDPEGSNLTYSVADPIYGSLSGTAPNLTYIPAEGHEGGDSFTFTVNDGEHDSEPATVSISVGYDGVNLSFTQFNTSLNANTLMVDGSTVDLGVAGAASGNDYIYTVSYTNDFDGDAIDDTLTFEVLVEAWGGGSAATGVDYSSPFVTTMNGTATIGTNDVQVTLGTAGFAVNGATMAVGQSLEFTVQNLNVTASSSAASALATGFDGVRLAEYNGGYGHQTIVGSGTGLLGVRWDNPNNLTGFNTASEPLFLTAGTNQGNGAAQERWQASNLKFSINIKPGGVPDISIEVSGSDLVFTWDDGGTYDVLTNNNLTIPSGWGVAAGDESSPVTIPVGSEPVLFYKLD